MPEDNIENNVDTSPVTETVETAPVAIETTENTDTSEAAKVVEKPVNSLSDLRAHREAKETLKAGKKENSDTTKRKSDDFDYRSAYEKIQKDHGKTTRELGELRKRDREHQQMLDAYNAAKRSQEEAQLLEQFKEDPQAAIREIARRETANQNAELREQVANVTAVNTNTVLQTQLGQDYETHVPVMIEIVKEAQELDEAKGTNYAEQIASRPDILIGLAKEKISFLQNKNTKVETDKKKADNLRIAGGVAKANATKGSTPVENFKELPLTEMTARLRQAGIIPKR